jgi:hypothetical protein
MISIPPREVFETLLDNEHVKIEHIISKGHISPEPGYQGVSSTFLPNLPSIF